MDKPACAWTPSIKKAKTAEKFLKHVKNLPQDAKEI